MKPGLLISFYGDDFTGSTDAMESLARCGVRTVLFTDPPTPTQLARHGDIRAFGVAGMTRSMPPDQMEQALRPALAALKQSGAPIVHYKVCSTFDSSPKVGSIGRVIEVGIDVFGARFVPLLVGAPPLGRYCAFGNLFARCGAESEPYRLDRHPSMSRHPTTPMDEADLRMHLAKQTRESIGLFDLLQLERPDVADAFDRFRASGCAVGLIDLMYERQLATVGALLDRCDRPTFVVGSSGVESALCAHWQESGTISGRSDFAPSRAAGPILVLCGSCSPVTAGQVAWAVRNGFAELALDVNRLESANISDVSAALKRGQSAVVHTRGSTSTTPVAASIVGPALGRMARRILDDVKVNRMAVAGGDTSGQVARAMGIESMEMVGELTRGSPLCRAVAPEAPADGIEITFKGGQIGAVDFFGLVQRGTDLKDTQ